MTEKIKTIFLGTPEFAVPSLKALINNPLFSLIAVFTQPDRPAGRGQKVNFSPIKEVALQNNIPVYQPEKIKLVGVDFNNLAPDLIVVVAYGQIIPLEILNIPRFGCVNVHGSLLPKYRGASCLAAPILNDDSETGVTIMKMNIGMDTGPIIKQVKISLTGKENLPWLHDQLAELGAQTLPSTLINYIAGKITPSAQDNALASYVSLLKKEDGYLDIYRSAETLERQTRALNPWPGTYLILSNQLLIANQNNEDHKIIKILQVDHDIIKGNFCAPGTFFNHQGKLAIQCGQNALHILKLQLPGGKPLSGVEFINGHRDKLQIINVK